MGAQDVLAFVTIGLALAFLAWKFVLEPRRRERGPHVTTRSLVRRARDKRGASMAAKSGSPPPCCG
jgi:hypothetical protein